MEEINKIDDEIKELKEKIARLETQKLAYMGLSDVQKLAEYIHKKQCRWNHTDGCGWFYESWDNPGYSRKEYLTKASNILAKGTFEQAMEFVKQL